MRHYEEVESVIRRVLKLLSGGEYELTGRELANLLEEYRDTELLHEADEIARDFTKVLGPIVREALRREDGACGIKK